MATTTFAANLQHTQERWLENNFGQPESWNHAASPDGVELKKFEVDVQQSHQMLTHPAKTASHMELVRHLQDNGLVTPMRVSTPEIAKLRKEIQQPRLPTKVKRGMMSEPAEPMTTYTTLGILAALIVLAATVYSS